MVTIARHEIDVASMKEAACRTAGDPLAASAETWGAVALSMQAGGAIFALTGQTDGEVAFRIEDRDITIPATGPKSSANAGEWNTAMSLAMICRERPRVDLLAAFPIDVLRASGGQADEFQYDWIRTLQAYWRSEEGLVDVLLRLHKQYWTATSERTSDPDGFVAWRVLAIACLAKDAGVGITVESGYLPKNLVDGTWVDEKAPTQ